MVFSLHKLVTFLQLIAKEKLDSVNAGFSEK